MGRPIKYRDSKFRKFYPTPAAYSPPIRKVKRNPNVIRMTAKYKGVCVSCNREITVGSTIRYHLQLRVAKHSHCL